jgi:outer membrane protein TolC
MGFLLRTTGLVRIRSCVVLVLGVYTGCAGPLPWQAAQSSTPNSHSSRLVELAPQIQAASLQDAGPTAPAACPARAAASQPPSAPAFVNTSELSIEALIEQVLARNPSLAEMIAVWQAATARYPQVTSLEDPMFAATIGPGTIAPDDAAVEFAYRLEISQKLPFSGKLRLRGENALAEASAAGHDVDAMRLQLIESARMAFADYYLVDRALTVRDQSLRLLQDFRKNAQARYETGQVTQQDVLQADVEIGREEDRRLELEQMREVTIARINTLMHLAPDSPLPPPPKELPVMEKLPDAQALRAAALARRPDLQARADRIAAEEAALALAHKEFYPDIEPFFMYDRFMGNMSDNRDLAAMLGVRLNLPVYKGRRDGWSPRPQPGSPSVERSWLDKRTRSTSTCRRPTRGC